ncbi:MAG: ABC transporter substrate-binding protein [Bdellovibrionales bacterium]|nr:ABC transporter substrate-binding protein [Bdellovibrionales bacterium]
MKWIVSFFVVFSVWSTSGLRAETKAEVVVGVATVLSGDLAVLGENIQKSVETYRRHHLRHPIRFEFEDAKKGSRDGLSAYQTLIGAKHVDVLLGGTTSNGTLAAKSLINSSKVPLITPLTGGSNIDQAGPYIFRIGNSDILNGYQQAEYFVAAGIRRVALLTEQTEYTEDIAKFFREKFLELGGSLVFDEAFLPTETNFRTEIAKIKSKEPQALFMSTQTGLAFGVFLKQFFELGGATEEIHTNFVAASNPDAFSAAGEAIYGVYYMAPYYDKANPKLIQFFKEYREDHGQDPAIAFHTAGIVDALNMLQDYLDSTKTFSGEEFREYLLKTIKNYRGLMGEYSFDRDGNANIGFDLARISKQ